MPIVHNACSPAADGAVIKVAAPTPDTFHVLVRALQTEFGCHAAAALAQRFIDAEECDFLWDARRRERWLGSWEADDSGWTDSSSDLDRIAVLGQLGAKWYWATLIVDGEGHPQGVISRGEHGSAAEAWRAWSRLH